MDFDFDTNTNWHNMMRHCVQGRHVITRDRPCRELIAFQTIIPMCRPLMTITHRKLSYRLAAAEALWILEGRNDVEFIAKHAPRYREFSDDGETLYGAYGVRYKEQFDVVVGALCRDMNTRQAVMTTWIKNPKLSKDIPCTVSLQFLIRDKQLYTVVNMRSNDAWLGWPYDIFSFTMMSIDILLRLRERNEKFRDVTPGVVVVIAGSAHVYEDDVLKFQPQQMSCGTYQSMSIHSLINPVHLRKCLSAVCDMRIGSDTPQFFKDMMRLHEETHAKKA